MGLPSVEAQNNQFENTPVKIGIDGLSHDHMHGLLNNYWFH